VVPFKVRRRAQAVRLAAQGWTAPRIARHLGLDRNTLHRDLRRWPERGIEGLEDGKPPGAKPRWTRVPRAWGRSGRVNAVAHLERLPQGGWALGYTLLEGLSREGVRGVVFLDHATCRGAAPI